MLMPKSRIETAMMGLRKAICRFVIFLCGRMPQNRFSLHRLAVYHLDVCMRCLIHLAALLSRACKVYLQKPPEGSSMAHGEQRMSTNRHGISPRGEAALSKQTREGLNQRSEHQKNHLKGLELSKRPPGTLEVDRFRLCSLLGLSVPQFLIVPVLVI